MKGTISSRVMRTLLAIVTLCTAVLVVTAAPANALYPPPDGGGSVLGGYVSRGEMMYRAQYWYDHRWDADMTYDNPGGAVLPFHRDYNNSRSYRRDCSGLVDNVWHLNGDNYTGNLSAVSWQLGSKSQLLAGDILLYAGVHVIIFKEWVSGSTFTYWSFGSTPVKIGQETLTGGSDGLIDSHAASSYRPYRYNKVA